jgi:CDP-paratose 2-epimerase
MSQSRSLTFLVTGGAGFIGSNLTQALAHQGHDVRIYDNLSRPGVRANLEWLVAQHGDRVTLVEACITDRHSLREAVRDVDGVFHLAAQVAVTTSLEQPLFDFETNLCGTLELLEALRALRRPPPLVYTSTNKVYGCLLDVEMRELERRWLPVDVVLARRGIAESRPLEFRSPYGCSKGAADQYVLDYAKSFGLPATVFRMSCIYGPRQMGSEAQGWVAHLLMRALEDQPITIFGDGKQVRDVLYVDDLMVALQRGWEHIDRLAGRAFNVGGGPDQTLSLLELIDMISAIQGESPELNFEAWRTADQQYYASDTRAFCRESGWSPQVNVSDGVNRLYHWLIERRRAQVSSARCAAGEGLLPAGETIHG